MNTRQTLLAALVAAVAFAAGPTFDGAVSARAACDPGDRIDGSTADQAKRKIEAQGYTQVRGLRKGCDNFWHATAVRNGIGGRVVLTPSGEVLPEGE